MSERHSAVWNRLSAKTFLVPFQKQDTDIEGEWLSWSEGGRGEQLFCHLFSRILLLLLLLFLPFRLHSAIPPEPAKCKKSRRPKARAGERGGTSERAGEHERICFHHAKQHHNMPRPSRRPPRPVRGPSLCDAPPFPPPCLSRQGTNALERDSFARGARTFTPEDEKGVCKTMGY